jgi:hypothetical protein
MTMSLKGKPSREWPEKMVYLLDARHFFSYSLRREFVSTDGPYHVDFPGENAINHSTHCSIA